VATLSGTTSSDTEKAQAESIAKAIAGSEVVANQIAARPPGDESTARDLDSALDKGIAIPKMAKAASSEELRSAAIWI
jgi:hypothetical protein